MIEGFLTPQCGEGCCGNGEIKTPCSCVGGIEPCGIWWTCFFPRSEFSLPSKRPHRVRILRGDTVVFESANSAGTYRPLDDNWGVGFESYRLEVCCDDPGYGACRWSTFAGPKDLIGSVSDVCPVTCSGVYTCISGQVYLDASGIINDADCPPTQVLIDGIPHAFEIVTVGINTVWRLINHASNQTPKPFPQCSPRTIDVRTSCGVGCRSIVSSCLACLNARVITISGATITRSYSWTSSPGTSSEETVSIDEVVVFPGLIAASIDNGCSVSPLGSAFAPAAYSVLLNVDRPSGVSGSIKTASYEITDGDLRFTPFAGGTLSVQKDGERTLNYDYEYWGGATSSYSGRDLWSGDGRLFAQTPSTVSVNPCGGGVASASALMNAYKNQFSSGCIHILFQLPSGLFFSSIPGTPICTTLDYLEQVVSL